MALPLNNLVNFDAGVGAYQRARCASDAGIGIGGIRKMVAAVVNLFGLECKNIAWTRHHTEVAALATLLLYGDGTVNFSHKLKID